MRNEMTRQTRQVRQHYYFLWGLSLIAAMGLSCSTSSKKWNDKSFLYLEEVEGEKALNWVRDHNKISLERLENDPRYKTYFNEAKNILTAEDRIPYGRIQNQWIYNFWQDNKNIRGVWRRTSLEQYQQAHPQWEIVLDLDKLATQEKENWVYKGSVCLPPKNEKCLLRLSRGGKDAAVIREFNTTTKKFVNDGFFVPEAKSDVAWLDEDHLIVGTDWGEGSLTESGYPRILKLWRRGSTMSAAQLLFEGEVEDMAVGASAIHRPHGVYHFVVQSLNFFESKYFFLNEKKEIIPLPLPTDVELLDVFREQVIVKLRKDWKFKGQNFKAGDLVSFSIKKFLESREIQTVDLLFHPSENMAFRDIGLTRDVLYISYLEDVVGQVSEYRWENEQWKSRAVPAPSNGTIDLVSTDNFSHLSFLEFESYVEPTQILLLNSKFNSLKKIKQLPARFKSNSMNVERFKVKSKDGEWIPYTVIHPKNMKMDGSNPTLLYAYGGFEISMTPSYLSITGKSWVSRGGVFVVANIRGGGEFGPRWHQAALKENRQKAFDDFISVAEDLIKKKITSPEHLGIQGGSNGGLLMGAVFTQRPELFKAVVCQVPLLDMMRFHLLLAGASWKAEYGDPEGRERKYIKAYSPFQNLKESTQYPEVFFVTSTKDDRVHPGHARKMAAKMEALNKPFLYYENIEGGHSASANLVQLAKRKALEMVYLTQKLGLGK